VVYELHGNGVNQRLEGRHGLVCHLGLTWGPPPQQRWPAA
jgi:hypothetical protein